MTSSSLRLIRTPSEQRKNVKHKNILWLQLKPLVAKSGGQDVMHGLLDPRTGKKAQESEVGEDLTAKKSVSCIQDSSSHKWKGCLF
uniref:Uncharacterized protein n=1 Tax=Candidozyma auris TaxID=498019 RepID=A0A0L0NRC5_CANAR